MEIKQSFLSASDLARKCGVNNSRVLRKIHRGEILPDANVSGILLFASSRLEEINQALNRKD